MTKKYKIDLAKIPDDDEYKGLLKEEMTKQEVAMLGTIIMKDKISKLKYKLFGWYYERKSKNKNQKKV
ncbi:MAG: hypothetical protein ACFFDN_02590 [Candidatus Hodarchaeota archaeon]